MPRRRGFTLIEVVVALMIFGLTAVVLGGAYLNVLNSYEAASRSNVNDVDVSFARSQLLGQPDLPTASATVEWRRQTECLFPLCQRCPAGTGREVARASAHTSTARRAR